MYWNLKCLIYCNYPFHRQIDNILNQQLSGEPLARKTKDNWDDRDSLINVLKVFILIK